MDPLERYYRFHARIYDATRWLFLFGRNRLLRIIQEQQPIPVHIIELGCGTGRNLVQLARRFPRSRITGIDLSPEMLRVASSKVARFGNRITLQKKLLKPTHEFPGDVILFSYSLSMMNPGWDQILGAAIAQLPPGGLLAVVDFHRSPVPLFQRHMENHHVRMGGHLFSYLEKQMPSAVRFVCSAYGGLWNYFLFAGKK